MEARRNGRWTAYRALVSAQLKELGREPDVVFWTFFFPLLLAIGLGIAFRQPPAVSTPVAVVAGPDARRVAAALPAPRFKVRVLAAAQALNGFRVGDFDLVIVPNSPGVEFRYDPARPESLLARAEANEALQVAAGRRDRLPARSLVYNAPGARYIDFLIPGLLGLTLMNGIWTLGYPLVDMRQRKLLKRLVAAPLHRTDFFLAVGSSRLLLMLAGVGVLLGAGVWLFRVQVVGSWFAVFVLTVLGAASFGALGVLLASRVEKIESVSGLINLVMMPMWVVSGVFFSYERFPAAVLPFIRALPLTALNDALRAVILQGAPLSAQGWRLLVLAIWGGASFGLALRWFRWT